jgi:hypothetical protein
LWWRSWRASLAYDKHIDYVEEINQTVEVPEETIARYEWIEDGEPYREWLGPADLINGYGPPRLVL